MTALSRPTIVIVGNDPDQVFACQRVIRDLVGWEYDILLTFSGERALAYIRTRNVELLIADEVLFQGMSGHELTDATRITSPQTRVVMATAQAIPVPQADMTVPLPLASSELAEAVRLLLL